MLRQLRSGTALPTPKVGSRWWPSPRTRSVALPSSTSVRCAAPKRLPVRIAAESAIWASRVASKVCGGLRQVSQLPHGSGKCFAEIAQQHLAAARGGLAVGQQRVEFGGLHPLDMFGRFTLGQHPAHVHHVC